jgi:hypothetical protein
VGAILHDFWEIGCLKSLQRHCNQGAVVKLPIYRALSQCLSPESISSPGLSSNPSFPSVDYVGRNLYSSSFLPDMTLRSSSVSVSRYLWKRRLRTRTVHRSTTIAIAVEVRVVLARRSSRIRRTRGWNARVNRQGLHIYVHIGGWSGIGRSGWRVSRRLETSTSLSGVLRRGLVTVVLGYHVLRPALEVYSGPFRGFNKGIRFLLRLVKVQKGAMGIQT